MNLHIRFFVVLIVVLLCIPSMTPIFAEILNLKVPSVALADSNRVILATPQDYDKTLKSGYPFIVMLHGWSGDETQWDNDADLQDLCDKYQVLLVLPDGGYDGWWMDSEVLPNRNYDTHIHQEIKIWMVENFNASKKASQHGVMGLSMGGFGAIYQVLKHPRSYAAAASLSGVLDITRHTKNWHLDKAFGKYDEAPERWTRNNPLHLAQGKAENDHPEMLLVCGIDDRMFQENVDIAKRFDQNGYRVVFRKEPGTHSHDFWRMHVESSIKFIHSKFEL